jgi:hypothetical protein
VVPDRESGIRRKKRSVIARLMDWRCLGMMAAVGLFVIVCIVVIIVKQKDTKKDD